MFTRNCLDAQRLHDEHCGRRPSDSTAFERGHSRSDCRQTQRTGREVAVQTQDILKAKTLPNSTLNFRMRQSAKLQAQYHFGQHTRALLRINSAVEFFLADDPTQSGATYRVENFLSNKARELLCKNRLMQRIADNIFTSDFAAHTGKVVYPMILEGETKQVSNINGFRAYRLWSVKLSAAQILAAGFVAFCIATASFAADVQIAQVFKLGVITWTEIFSVSAAKATPRTRTTKISYRPNKR